MYPMSKSFILKYVFTVVDRQVANFMYKIDIFKSGKTNLPWICKRFIGEHFNNPLVKHSFILHTVSGDIKDHSFVGLC